ncbi:MAG TPA: glucose-6-phosphate dehydrogenase assembly protein OpcA [Blastocatellia bacterium]|nr:glucose-6-phosphate dehydrogenase assembly protein OpcA [Blastocatellia bacterium]
MSTDKNTGEAPGTGASSIDVAGIERQLISLWKQASEDEEGGVIRASMLNLIVYVPSAKKSNHLSDAIVEITSEHPCRAILILADREAGEDSITAEVTSLCTIPDTSHKQVCCEEVAISATGAMVDEAPSAVAPLLLSDLPVYLWWRAVPQLTDRIFRRLVDISDRVIIDSSTFADPRGDLINLAAMLKEKPRWTALTDLNWARLTAWRALIAGFYDVPAYRPMMERLGRVVIEYSPSSQDTGGISPRALLLGGWLASRLGWKIDPRARASTEEATTYELRAEGRSVTMEFARTRRPLIEPGHLAFVALTSEAPASSTFNVRRSSDGTRIETEVHAETRIQRVLSYESCAESALISRELEFSGHDRVFEQAVVAAREFLGP